MVKPNDPKHRVWQSARRLLREGFGDELARTSGAVAPPVPVESPQRALHSWFVPVTVGDRLAGFFQVLPDLTPMRYSSFQRRPGALDTCPDAAAWLDPATIRHSALSLAGPGETAGEPYLSFDTVPERLAWAVPLVAPDGASRIVYVAGDFAWEPSPPGEPSFGGGLG